MLLRNLASATTSKLIRLVLTVGVLAFLASLVTTNTQVQAFSGTGSGTASDPYLISTCAQLQSIGDISSDIDALYWLANDIDCASIANFTPIPEFDGTLDGRNHTISNLTINLPSTNDVALIQDLNSDSLVTNLIFDNTNTITGGSSTGTLAGSASSASIRQVHSAATVVATVSPAGGLVGTTDGWENDMIIEQSSFTGDLTSDDWAGGMVGRANNGYTIRDILIDADINGYALGGVVGQSNQSCGYRYIERAMVRGTITGDSYIGGFVGGYQDNTCYAQEISDSVSQATLIGSGAVGGAIGRVANSDITISNSFFEETNANTTDCVGVIASGTSSSCGDIGSNVPPSSEPYAQWDFDDIWQESSGVVSFQTPAILLDGPDAPTGVVAVEGAGVTDVDISFTAPASFGSYSNDLYRVEIKKASDDWPTVFDRTTDTSLSAQFGNLRLGTEYDIRVQAETNYGPSEWAEISYTTQDPVVYSADTCEELQAFSATGTQYDTYILTDDIDCSGIGDFVPQSWGDAFAGTFDGQGNTISNLTIVGDDSYDFGLFDETEGAILRDVYIDTGSVNVISDSGNCGALVGRAYDTVIESVVVENFSLVCGTSVGGIVGYYEHGSSSSETLENLSFKGSVEAVNYNAGGLIGEIDVNDEANLRITESYADATVTAGEARSGGLIGSAYAENDDDTVTPTTFLLQDSYATGDVVSDYSAGGLIGDAESYNDGYDSVAEVEVENSYSAASVTAIGDSAGGIIGYMDDLGDEGENVVLNNVFAAGEVNAPDFAYALIGGDDGVSDGMLTINNSFFDQTVTGQSAESHYDVSGWTAVNEDGLEGSYFKNNSVNDPLSDWDFESVWEVKTNDFPILQWGEVTDSEGGIDTDDDGLEDSIEDNGPNDGDANNDGTLDSLQAHVTTFNYDDENYMVVETSCDANFNVSNGLESDENNDAGYDYPTGLVQFVGVDCGAPGVTVSVRIIYFGDLDASELVLRKWADDSSYSTITDATLRNVSLDGLNAVEAEYIVVDGGELDQDGIADGNIVDPVGLAEQVVGAPNTGLQQLSR